MEFQISEFRFQILEITEDTEGGHAAISSEVPILILKSEILNSTFQLG